MDNNYPKKLIDQYLKASSKLKKFDRVVFKRFAPNASEVLEDFSRLALKFEEAAIYQYAAMCYLGVAKCEMSSGNAVNECQAYLKAARSFLRANSTVDALQLRSNRQEYKAGALLCYTHALERNADDSVLKAAIIREMTPLQPHYEGASSFASPAHRIYELEQAAGACVRQRDFLAALQQLDDIVDNVYERKQQRLYEELLQRTEVLRVLLLVALNLPPVRQSPAHIQLIEHYYQLANFEDLRADAALYSAAASSRSCPGAYVPLQLQFALGEIVLAWHERADDQLKLALLEFRAEFRSLNAAQHFVLTTICDSIGANYFY